MTPHERRQAEVARIFAALEAADRDAEQRRAHQERRAAQATASKANASEGNPTPLAGLSTT